MRTVAVAFVALFVAASFPTAASADECKTPGALSFCVPIDASRPNSPPGVPSIPNTPYWGVYYLWVGAGHCLGTNLNDCRSYPPGAPVGVPLPNGGYVGSGTFGVLFQESNGAPGLQRTFTTRAADRMVLV